MSKRKNELDSFLNQEKKGPKPSLYNRIKTRFLNSSFMIQQRRYFDYNLVRFKAFRKESLPLLLFIGFSTYVTWLMHDDLDEIKRKVQKSQSRKQEMAERENDMLKNIIQDPRNQNYNKQVREIQRSKKYAYEKYGENEDDVYEQSGHMYLNLNQDEEKD